MIVDAMGRPTFEKNFEDMGGAAQRAVIKQGIGHLMMGQCLIVEGLLSIKKGGVSDEYSKKARRWLDSFTGEGKGGKQDGLATGTASSDTGRSESPSEGSGGAEDTTELKK